jgi:hypothetical protein
MILTRGSHLLVKKERRRGEGVLRVGWLGWFARVGPVGLSALFSLKMIFVFPF